jgi:addiction module RelB/DinJ family antitoxin
MDAVTINIRVNAKDKKEAQKVFKDLGLSFSSGVNVYLRQVARQKAIPFPLEADTPTPKARGIIKAGLQEAASGHCQTITSQEELDQSTGTIVGNSADIKVQKKSKKSD